MAFWASIASSQPHHQGDNNKDNKTMAKPVMREKRDGKSFLRIEVDESMVKDINQYWPTDDHAALQKRDDEWAKTFIKDIVDGLDLGTVTHSDAKTYKAIAAAAEKAYKKGGRSANAIFQSRLKSALK